MNWLTLGQQTWPDFNDYANATSPQAESIVKILAPIMLIDVAITSYIIAYYGRVKNLSRVTVALLNMLVALFFFVRLEFALRMSYNNYIVQVTKFNRPDADAIWSSQPSTPAQKLPGEIRVLCLGDSSTIYHRADTKNYPEWLQTLLSKYDGISGHVFRVKNGGIPGYTSLQGLRFLDDHGAAFKPDIVIIGYGFHDAVNEIIADKEYMLEGQPLQWRKLFFESQIYWVLRNWILRIQYAGRPLPPRRVRRVALPDYYQNLVQFLEWTQQHSARLMIVNMPQNPARELPDDFALRLRYHTVNINFGRERKLPVVDVSHIWGEHPPPGVFVDANHLTDAGAHAVAEQILDVMKRSWPNLFAGGSH